MSCASKSPAASRPRPSIASIGGLTRQSETPAIPRGAVVLDCEKLDRVTGIGWHHVLLLARSLGRRGATLHLAALPPDLQDVFRDVSFRGLLTIHRSNTEAMTALL